MPTQPAPTTTSRLIVKRDGRAITGQVPRPSVIIDSREQHPFDFTGYTNWIAATTRAALETGDYSVEGMEQLLCLERKSMADMVGTLCHSRDRFLGQRERMVVFPHKAILIEATWEEMKTPYPEEVYTQEGYRRHLAGAPQPGRLRTKAHPNGIVGSLDAINARFGIEIIYTSRGRALATERAASYLSKHFTYHHLETNGLGRFLQDGDL